MRPGRRLVGLLAAVCAAALFVPLRPELVWLWLFVLMAALGAATLEAVRLRGMVLTLDRAGRLVLPLGQDETVSLAVRTDARRPVLLELRQTWPSLLAGGSVTRHGLCRPGEVLQFDLPVRGIARGKEPLAPPTVAATCWQLAERVTTLGEPTEVSVYPDLRAVARLHAQLNQYVLRGLGARMSARLGKGREFDRMREYVLGDEFRDVAWKASARHGKLIVKEYRIDRSQEIVVCLDRGHRMAARVAGLTKLDHAVNASVLLAYSCNRMEDRVGILSFAAEVTSGLRPGKGMAHLRRVTEFAAAARADFVHTDYLALAASLRRAARQRSLVVILTALPEIDQADLLKAVRLMRPHLPLVVVLSDPDLKAAAQFRPATRAELSRTLVAQDLWTAREQTMRELRRLGALVVESAPQDAGVDAMNAYIEVKRRQLL
jgi:uncharacterized protein (DUF58 family)